MEQWLFRSSPRLDLWTPEQLDILRRMAGVFDAAEIATAVNRSVASVRVKAHKLNLSLAVQRQYRHWLASDVQVLRRLAPTHTPQQIAGIMGRPAGTIKNKARELNISFQRHGEMHHNAKYGADKIRVLAEMKASGQTARAIAEATGMSKENAERIMNYESRHRELMAIEQEMAER